MPITDVDQAIANSPALQTDEFTVAASQSFLPIDAVQTGSGRELEPYLVRGLDDAFLDQHHLRAGKGCRRVRLVARGVGGGGLPAQSRRGGQLRRPQAGQLVFGAPADFRLTGFYFDEGTFEPVTVEVRGTQDGYDRRADRDRDPLRDDPARDVRDPTSQASLETAFPGRAYPTTFYFDVAPGVEPGDMATRLESAFLGNGMEAESIHKVMADATAGAVTFNRLIQGFMGLDSSSACGRAGVISARSVVERRQQIGVMRAIGFRGG